MRSKKILIVEDDQALAHVLRLKLESGGYAVETAETGRIALERIQADGYALILLDLILPDIDGFHVLESMREHDHATPVIVLTNLQQDEDKKRIEQKGVSGYFVKSDVSLVDVAAFVKKTLGENE